MDGVKLPRIAISTHGSEVILLGLLALTAAGYRYLDKIAHRLKCNWGLHNCAAIDPVEG